MKYIKEDIEKMLINHKENEGKLFEIELKLDEYKTRLEYAGTVYQDTENEVIENMQLAGQPYDSIHSNTNKVSDKVSSTAMNYKQEQVHINNEDRNHLEAEINKLTIEKEKINKRIARVINWLDKIEEKQKCIIEEYYINNKGRNWDRAVTEYNRQYTELTERRLRDIREEGLNNILKMVNI